MLLQQQHCNGRTGKVKAKNKVGVKIPSRRLSDIFLAGRNKLNILPRVLVAQIQRVTSVKTRFGSLSIPQVQSFGELKISAVDQGLTTLLEREAAL